MKWSEVKRRLKMYGCYKYKNGTNHERWKSPITGAIKNIGRHDSQEVNTKTAADIFKAMGVPMYDA